MLIFVIFGTTSLNWAQDISATLSSGHDPNIFDNYSGVGDQVMIWGLSLGKDWDADRFSLSSEYNGTFQTYGEVSARNYSVHALSLTPSIIVSMHEDEEEENAPDSSDESDSTTAPIQPPTIKKSDIPSDSLNQVLLGSFSYTSQLNRVEFGDYDNSRIAGSVGYRLPIADRFTFWPTVLLAYHHYPNLEGLTSSENALIFSLSRWGAGLDWLEGTVGYSVKSYPVSMGYNDTVRAGSPGKGKGGAAPPKVVHYDLTTPSVAQFGFGAVIKKSFGSSSKIQLELRHYGTPSQEARILPRRLTNQLNETGDLGSLTGQNDAYDDHFAFRGDAVSISLEESLPFGLTLAGEAALQSKFYTSAATNLLDSVTADHRLDHRVDASITLSRTITFIKGGSSLKPQIMFAYIRNSSNAEYYDFDKAAIFFGVEFTY